MSVKSNQLTNKYVFQMNVNDLLMNFHFENETPINGLKNMPSPNLIQIFIFEIDRIHPFKVQVSCNSNVIH